MYDKRFKLRTDIVDGFVIRLLAACIRLLPRRSSNSSELMCLLARTRYAKAIG